MRGGKTTIDRTPTRILDADPLDIIVSQSIAWNDAVNT